MSKYTIMKRSKYTRGNGKQNLLLLLILFFALFFSYLSHRSVPTSYAADSLWSVRSVDTMKSSRDLARAKLHDKAFDETIKTEVQLIKGMGANYIALGTPYDDEFLPFLKRWVSAARAEGLKIWYRGTFSNYEGWFGYTKNMSPAQLLTRTSQFIEAHPDLFEEGDIFDPCPECENAGHWKQPLLDDTYNQFMKEKDDVLEQSFKKINKKVIYNWNSVIGGRAKDVLKGDTFSHLGNVIALDHYVSDTNNYEEYIKYFNENFETVSIFSEFGAPIPDLHGKMTEQQQADFIEKIMQEFYQHKENVAGVNYWVLSGGTTSLYNADYTPRKVVNVMKKYFMPGIIRGKVIDTLGTNLENIRVATTDGNNATYTNRNGDYQLIVPVGTTEYVVEHDKYETKSHKVELTYNERIEQNFELTPKDTGFIYDIRKSIKDQMSSFWSKFQTNE